MGIQCRLEANVQKVNEVICDESNKDLYPNIEIGIGNHSFPLEPEDYIESCAFKYVKRQCRLRIQQLDHNYMILGDLFMRK